MPNWCENNLEVSGDEKELKKFMSLFIKKIGKNDIEVNFNAIVPMPKELEGTKAPSDKPNRKLIKKYGFDNWYDWSIANWGTKWNPSFSSMSYKKGGTEAYIDFDSAWSPPSAFLEKASKKFPKLYFTMKYDEPGMGFGGRVSAEKGQMSEY